MQERVQKILSQWGIASRRQAEEMILAGRVQVNGAPIQLGQKADPEYDRLEVDGIPLQTGSRPQPLYLLLHKPAGVVSTCQDPQGRTTVLDLLPPAVRSNSGIHPVGRLDGESTGALLLTNDGALTFYLTHPRHHIPKTYQVWVEGHPSVDALQQWQQGVNLEGRRTLPADITVLATQPHATLLEVVLREGRNRQIRRTAELLGHPVLQLHRTAIGPIRLQLPGQAPLPEGHYRPLQEFEIHFLQTQFDLPSVRMPAVVKEHRV